MAIKNFQGARKQQNETNNEAAVKVSDYMNTNVITFNTNQSIENVMQIMMDKNISGGPVINEKKELIGIITEGDCLKQITESRYYNLPIQDQTVNKFMIKNVETIDGNMNIFDAAKKFLDVKRRRFPIVENGKLVGQITQKSVFRAAMQLKGQKWK